MKTEVKGFFKNRRPPPGIGSFLLMARRLWYGPMGVCIAIPVAETLIGLAARIVFRRGKWKLVVA
jgi:Na+-driven multidrug efflux pump